MNQINWQFCKDPNEINDVLSKGGDYNWEGLTDASQIINIFYFEDHRNYMVFWANEALKAKMDGDMGEVSDGYHTFNQLYHQRAVLFATIVKQNKEKAWKSWKHGDGKFCFDSNKEWFIVGVDTPEGSYTYHYEKKYWDMFDCVELERGKFWDGHTEDDVTRLLSLQSADSNANQHVGSVDLISRQDALIEARPEFLNPQQQSECVLYNQGWNDAITGYYDNIKRLPSADRPTGWIPVIWHEITDEERNREGYPKDWVVHIDCEMPSDEQKILVTTRWGTAEEDVCYEDGEFSLDSGYDWIDDIVAWMPLPEPYREDGER